MKRNATAATPRKAQAKMSDLAIRYGGLTKVVPPHVAAKIRRIAKAKGKSEDEIVIDILKKARCVADGLFLPVR